MWRRPGERPPRGIDRDGDVALDSGGACSMLPRFIVIYESELRTIAGISALSPKLETGGEYYGLLTRNGNVVIWLVVGPALQAIHRRDFFRQDIDFFRRVSGVLSAGYFLEVKGTFHWHHSLGLAGPSKFDVAQVRRIAVRNNLQQWCEIITSYADEGDEEATHNRPACHPVWRGRHSRIRVKAFLYADPQHGEKREVPLCVIPGVSPCRTVAIASGKLEPDEIGEYASGFPMEKILFDCYDPRTSSIASRPAVLELLSKQCLQLPGEVRRAIHFDVKDRLVAVTLPLLHGDTIRIVYDDETPHSVRAIFLCHHKTGQLQEVTDMLLPDGCAATLKSIYETLLWQQAGHLAHRCHDSKVHAESSEE